MAKVPLEPRRGFRNRLTGQVGEFLVCAELGRRGYVATPFSGNVPGYDVIATNEGMVSVPIQVKSIRSPGAWQYNYDHWLKTSFDEKTGIRRIIGSKKLANPELVHVFVWLAQDKQTRDRLFICTKRDVQKLITEEAGAYLKRHGGRRPRKPESTHGALPDLWFEKYKDNWSLIERRLSRKRPLL